MKVGIIGSGEAGQRLALGFAKRGHDVVIGTRDPSAGKLADWEKQVEGKARVGNFAEAAGHGDVIVLVTLGEALMNALDLAGLERFASKLVIDVTNPLDFSNGMPPGLFVGITDSLGERVQRKLPTAKVVKAFNTVPNSRMVDPNLPDARLPICGDDDAAKKQVESIAREFGWDAVLDLGGIESSRWLEAHVALWVRAGIALDRFDHVLDIRY